MVIAQRRLGEVLTDMSEDGAKLQRGTGDVAICATKVFTFSDEVCTTFRR